ncbi:MAG: hypothetical protein E3J81_01015 [Dehalococcoidia bacterium]|nr:MAG: hypothetical protein E3J81_01015 [Dehalococcoidia bacterium]
MPSTWDVRVASPRRLLLSLHNFLDEHGYAHEYEPSEAEPNAGSGPAIFKSELIGKRDSPRRDRAYLVFGLLLLPTILLTTLGIQFLKASRYYLRTIARISVEGEVYPTRGGGQGTVQSGELDTVCDARVTLDMTAGVAQGDYEIVRPTEDKRELVRLAEEQRQLSELLPTIALPQADASPEH